MVRMSGGCLGLLAFSVALVAGLSVGNPVTTILSRALWALFSFYVLGAVLGYLAMRVIDEYALRRNREIFGDEGPPPATSEASAEASVVTAEVAE
jgi:hypothetical protein